MEATDTTLYSDPNAHNYLKKLIADNHHRPIITNLVKKLGLRKDDKVLEIGAGYGRYTSELLHNGLKVIATEPDAHMHEILEGNFNNNSKVKCLNAFVDDQLKLEKQVDAVGAFHVLHHLQHDDFEKIVSFCKLEKNRNKNFKGLFFFEPNPINPLYPIQIACRPSMHFSEEKGMWKMEKMVREILDDSVEIETYSVGLFPPSQKLNLLPNFVTSMMTSFNKKNAPFYAYKIFWFKF